MAISKAPKVCIDVVEAPIELLAKGIVEEELAAEKAEDTAVLENVGTEQAEPSKAAEPEPEPEPEPSDSDDETVPEADFEAAPTPDPIPVMSAADQDEPSAPAVEHRAKPAPIVQFAWLSRHFPGHEHAVLGCIFGLLTGIGILTIGPLNTGLLLACMVLGIELGNCIDGNGGLLSHLKGRSKKK